MDVSCSFWWWQRFFFHFESLFKGIGISGNVGVVSCSIGRGPYVYRGVFIGWQKSNQSLQDVPYAKVKWPMGLFFSHFGRHLARFMVTATWTWLYQFLHEYEENRRIIRIECMHDMYSMPWYVKIALPVSEMEGTRRIIGIICMDDIICMAETNKIDLRIWERKYYHHNPHL